MDKKYLIIIFVLFSLVLLPNVFAIQKNTTISQLTQANLPNATAIWHFDEVSGTLYDYAGTINNTGTLENGAITVDTDKIFGRSLNLTRDNNNYVSLIQGEIAPTTNVINWAWGGWVNVTGYAETLREIIGNYHEGDGKGFHLYLSSVDNKAYCRVGGTSGGYIKSDVAIPLNEWTHIVCVLENAVLKMYVNGILQVETSSSRNIGLSSKNVLIGVHVHAMDYYFPGRLDDLVIANYALNQDVIRNIYYNNFTDETSSPSGSVQVTLLSPANNTINNTNTYTFTYNNSVSNANLTNCSLYTNHTGTWKINQTFQSIKCYQESANVSTICGGKSTGNYSFYGAWLNNYSLIDENWSSTSSSDSNDDELIINYTKPINSTSSSLWQVKWRSGWASYNTSNISISTSCWNYYTDNILLNISRDDGHTYFNCFNGTGFEILAQDSSGFHNGVYEEAMWWDILNIPNGTYSFNINIETDGSYIWNVQCTQDNGSTYFANNNWTFTKDTILPSITTNFTNNLSFYQNNLTVFVNLSDDNLYRVNITIDNLQKYYNDALTGYTNWLYNFTYSTNNLSVGAHTLKVEVADGHTSNAISSYQINKGFLDNSLNFRTKTNYISIISQDIDLFADFNYEKKVDRYTFDYVPSKIEQNIYSFVVSSDKDIQIINNDKTEYKTWLISGNNWIDFYLPELKEITPKITRISKNRVKVDIDLTKTDTDKISSLSFNSIGDLNINSYNYSFYVGNYTVIFNSPILESTTTMIYLNITYNSSFMSDINAILNYNGTNYNPDSKLISSSSYLFSKTISIGLIGNTITNNSLFWNFNITGITTNNTNQSTRLYNQTIEYINVYNCTYSNESQALNFSYLKEIDNSKMTVNSSGIITIWSNPAYKKTFNLKYNEAYNSTYCIYPTTQNLTADIQFAFTSAGYIDENYIKSSIPINTTNHLTQNIYFTDITSSTAITITLYDSTSNLIPGYNIEAWKYDLAMNDYTLMDTQRTDQNGQVVMYLVTGNNEYVFKVKDTSGTLVYTSVKMKLYTTSYTFRLQSTSELGPTLFKLSQFGCPLSFTNSTSLVTAVYNDIGGLGSAYYLKLYTSNITNSTLIGSTSSAFTATTLSLNVPTTPNFYTAIFYIDYKADGSNHAICSIGIDRRTDAQTLGLTETLLMSAIFIGTLALIGITISAEIALILLLVGFVALMSMGLLTFGATYGIGGLVVVIFIFIYKLYKRGY